MKMLDKYDKNKNPFKVPENYFEGITKNVMDNLPIQEQKKVKKIQLWKQVLPWTGVAAVVVAIILSVSIFDGMPQNHSDNLQTNETNNMQQQLAYNEIEDYILFLEEEADQYEYVDLLFEEE